MRVAHMLACATRKQVPRARPACSGSDRMIQAAVPILATMDIGIRVLERISFRRDRREVVSLFCELVKRMPNNDQCASARGKPEEALIGCYSCGARRSRSGHSDRLSDLTSGTSRTSQMY